MDLWHDVMKMALYPVIFTKTHDHILIVRKISEKFQLRGMLLYTWPVLLKIVKVIKTKENLRNCYKQEESMETWQLNVM